MRRPKKTDITMERIDKQSKISCNQQLKEMLRDIIRKNWREPGFTLPSEERLCEYHDLARGTVRKAIGELVAEGLLAKRPGKGTFINSSCGEERLMSNAGGLVAMITTLGPSSFSTSDLVSGIDNVVARHGYFLVLKGTGINQVVAEAKILEILSRRCEGIIAYSMGDPALIPAYQALVEKKFPLVMVDRFFPELETDRVVVEEKAGMKEATNHLINLGCQHLLYLTVPHNLSSVKLRFEGFLAAVSEHPGVSHSAETINYLGLEMDRTDRAPLKKILERKLQESPEFGIVCAHDGLASFAYDVCLEMAISVPDQVMIMGYGDEPSTRERGISTMRFSFEEMGMEAATILIDKIERRSRKQHHVLIHSEMILRNTTKPHP